jgi:putative signal transducing protein
MKRIYSSQNGGEVEVLQNMLGATGISCIIRKDYVAPTPHSAFQPELWVLNDADSPKAEDFCERWRHPSPDRPPYWMCGKCGAGSEEQFNSCWKCGTNRDATIGLPDHLSRVAGKKLWPCP